MFCVNCGQQLPDGATFCMKCGTPQGAISPIGTNQANSIDFDEEDTLVPAMCPNCNAHIKVNPSYKIARCETCGAECLVQDAIKALAVNIETNTEDLLDRVEMVLKYGEYNKARIMCDTIIDIVPSNGSIYLFRLMSDLCCRTRNELAAQKNPFDSDKFYLKAMQYGDPELKYELQGYINVINARNEANTNNPKMGEEFHFGTQDGHWICWKVLSVRDHRALIISSNIICEKAYHEPRGNITWADCTLRKWLNRAFINDYFTPAEKARILPCKIENDNNPLYKTPGCAPTTDKVFLLSINEAIQFFSYEVERDNGYWWWLRSPGGDTGTAALVDEDGEIDLYGDYAFDYDGIGVRPAMWILLE